MAAIDRIAPSSIQHKKLYSSNIQLLISRWQIIFKRQKRLDFDSFEALSDGQCITLTSL